MIFRDIERMAPCPARCVILHAWTNGCSRIDAFPGRPLAHTTTRTDLSVSNRCCRRRIWRTAVLIWSERGFSIDSPTEVGTLSHVLQGVLDIVGRKTGEAADRLNVSQQKFPRRALPLPRPPEHSAGESRLFHASAEVLAMGRAELLSSASRSSGERIPEPAQYLEYHPTPLQRIHAGFGRS